MLQAGRCHVRYFFDVKIKDAVEHDYQGMFLPSLEHAQQTAELIAMDLGCTRLDGSFGMEVQIRNAVGKLLAFVPVSQAEVLAA
jgi:hypothetical protein